MPSFWSQYGEAVETAAGFFWKAGWAFVLGYAISAMIQVFVPKGRLSRHMSEPDVRSVSLATVFGTISSSCSFAALAAARSLVLKGAHFVAAVAFMFASTNLVIELGILILIFLGWQYLIAEILGGLVLIVVSTVLIRLTYPEEWATAAREKVERETAPEQEDFDPWQRMRTREGWRRVGHQFVIEWKMVWREILVGFTIAGFMKVFVPTSFWERLFLIGERGSIPDSLLALQNAAVAPFVACLTFIGSMGNIPLAAVLAGSGVAFAGVMGFIYSDLMVPPLVKVNARYYGWRIALYIAGIMYVSIVVTAMVSSGFFSLLGILPETVREHGAQGVFEIDYTFWLNLLLAGCALVLIWLHREYVAEGDSETGGEMQGGGRIQRAVTAVMILVLIGGLMAAIVTSG